MLVNLPSLIPNQATIADQSSSAIASHELRTLLTPLWGAIRLLQTGRLDLHSERGQRLLAIASLNTERLMGLVNRWESEALLDRDLTANNPLSYLQLEASLRTALKQGILQLQYQPIVNLETGHIKGFEALLRWRHEERWISPADFIPLAETCGLIHPIGLWVLRQACLQAQSWQELLPDNCPSVSVNLSAKQLDHPDLAQQVHTILQESGCPPHCLQLEVTESGTMQNLELAKATLEQIKTLGVQIYLDDFGTGYSSLSQLQSLPVDTLKIDRSFVLQHQWGLIKMILMVAEYFGLNVIAEGVESGEQATQLRHLGCHLAQGFFFSHPLSSQAATELLLAC
jgi:EAL domain-containing protein (putative c-di-GMP-specific phosphodiesterase class I)